MSAEISEAVEAEIKLTPGSGGIFDVSVDGRIIFSKFKSGRFPNSGEIASLLNN